MLRRGELSLHGRLIDASNATLAGACALDGVTVECVYKPVAGERGLWDFPGVRLADREAATARLAELAGWEHVPTTVLRPEGPFGEGMCQEWREPSEDREAVTVLAPDDVEAGWLAVVRGVDHDGREVAVVHEDSAGVREVALLDVLTNNADRKGGHLFYDQAGRLCAIDHGVTFHPEPKLRTVLWGFAGQPLSADESDQVERAVRAAAEDPELSSLLGAQERRALELRAGELLSSARFPEPDPDRSALPWPIF